MQGATNVALTVLDPLGYLKEIPMCVGYEIDGVVTKDFPTTQKLEKAKPVYKVLPGWNCDIRGIRKLRGSARGLPQLYRHIEQEIQVPITLVSTDRKRRDHPQRVKVTVIFTNKKSRQGIPCLFFFETKNIVDFLMFMWLK